MAKTKACKFCRKKSDKENGVMVNMSFFCNFKCAAQHGIKLSLASKKRQAANKEKADRKDLKKRKEAIKKRTGKNGYYDNLKTELHRYIKHVLRKGEPCYTCDKPQLPTDSPQAFHVGHFIPQKQVDPRRFMLMNLRMQCYKCNTHNSGMRMEYRQRLVDELGLEQVEWLECDANHQELKEQYPEKSDIKSETSMYRKLANGNHIDEIMK